MTSGLRGACVAGVVAIAIAVGACGGDTDTPAYCDDRAALQRSLEGLRDFDVRADGLDALEARLEQVQRNAATLVRSAQSEFGPEASALQSAVTALTTSVGQATATPSPQSVAEVVSDVSGVASAFSALSDEVSASC